MCGERLCCQAFQSLQFLTVSFVRKLHLLTRTRSHRGEEPDLTEEKNDTLFRKRLLSYPAVWVKKWRGVNDLTWCKNGQVREVVGNLGEGGHTVLFPGFFEANVSFSYFLLGASNLEQFLPWCCILDIPSYVRLYLNILEFFVNHLVYTTINSVWGLHHLFYLTSCSLTSITCLHITPHSWRFLSCHRSD